MAGSDVVEAMRLALKPFNIQHLADDWNANRTYLQLSVQRCQHGSFRICGEMLLACLAWPI